MADPVQVGLVSTSWWADLMFLPALKSHPHAEIAAICGRNKARADEMAAKHGVSKVYVDYREMLDQAGLDAVIVAAPDDVHHEITMAALRAGLHVLCEKPLALSAPQAREMYETAEAAGVKHMVHFTYRWMPPLRYVRDLIDQGYIGRCNHCDFHYLADYGRSQEYQWRFDQRRANGVLGDLGAHVIDMAHWLVGDIARVSARLGVFVKRLGVDGAPLEPANDTALLIAEFSNGAHCLIQASAVAHMADRGFQQQVRLYGDAGSLEVLLPYFGSEAGAIIRGARMADERFQTLEVPASYWGAVSPAEPFGIFTEHPAGCRLFIDAIRNDRVAGPTFYDGYKVQRVIEAAMEAHRSGQSVSIESVA